MSELTILVPVLRRPQNAERLVESIEATTEVDHQILFILSPNDDDEYNVVLELTRARRCRLGIMEESFEGRGDYARKINAGYIWSDSEWYFLGADDLRFHPYWFENAMKINACVIGTNDLGNSRVKAGQHSTHSLVNRQYVEEQGTIDEKNKILHEGYTHCFCDDELVQTAQRRGCFGFASDCYVEHLHPLWNKGTMDATYESATKNFERDRLLFQQRRNLWMR